MKNISDIDVLRLYNRLHGSGVTSGAALWDAYFKQKHVRHFLLLDNNTFKTTLNLN